MTGPEGWAAAQSLAIADLVLFAGGSLLCALLIDRASRLAEPATWGLLGVTLYATLIAAKWLSEPVSDSTGLLAMLPAAAATAACAWSVHRGQAHV